jgi:hypothetical protein
MRFFSGRLCLFAVAGHKSATGSGATPNDPTVTALPAVAAVPAPESVETPIAVMRAG